MLDLSALVSSARRELGLPAASSDPTDATDSTGRNGEATTLPVEASAPLHRVSARMDEILLTMNGLGVRFRPAVQALADIANGTAAVLDPAQLVAARAARRPAATQLAALYAEAVEHGARSMPRAPRMGGNRVELLVRNKQYLPRLYADLERATRSITVNQFSWEPNGSGARVAEILRRKAAAGLDVRVMVDGYGIKEPGRDVANALQRSLEAAGVRFVRTDGLKLGGNGFEHRKLITIDDRIAFVGGLGFGAKYDAWTDLMVRIEGPTAAVASATALGSYRELSGAADAPLLARAKKLGGALRDAVAGVAHLHDGPPRRGPLADARAAVTLLDNRPGSDLASTEAFLRDAAAARRRLWATSTYITTPVAAKALIDAARRGVDVKLVMTGPEAGNDVKQITLARALMAPMIDAGVEIYEFPTVLHAKSWLRDDDVAAVGSMNLSRSSMVRAREITARIEDADFTKAYARFHDQTRAGARLVQRGDVDGIAMRALALLNRIGLQF